jgi:TPR repeat protein
MDILKKLPRCGTFVTIVTTVWLLGCATTIRRSFTQTQQSSQRTQVHVTRTTQPERTFERAPTTITSQVDQCLNGSRAVCDEMFLEATRLDRNDSTPKQLAQAARFYTSICNERFADREHYENISKACARLAEMYREGIVFQKNSERSIWFDDLACKAGNSVSCENPAELYRKGFSRDSGVVKLLVEIEKSCERGNKRSCPVAAYQYYSFITYIAPDDHALAGRLFRKGCDLGDGVSCWNLADFIKTGFGGLRKDKKEAKEMYERAARVFQYDCERGDGDACRALAEQYGSGKGVALDTAEMERLNQKGCDLGSPRACSDLAYAYSEGENGVRKDSKRAYEFKQREVVLLEKACNEGKTHECLEAAFVYKDGQTGVKADLSRAVILLEKNCSAGILNACEILSDMYKHGDDTIKKDMARAIDLEDQYITEYKKRCGRGGVISCVELGDRYRRGECLPKDDVKAAELYSRACLEIGSSGWDCDKLSVMYENGEGGLRKDSQKAMQLRYRACGTDPSCYYLAEYYKDGIFRHNIGKLPRDTPNAALFFKRGCENAREEDCTLLGNMYDFGLGGLKIDEDQAFGLYRWACQRGYDGACTHMKRLESHTTCKGEACRILAEARYYFDDQKGAERLLDRACFLGDQLSCLILASSYLSGEAAILYKGEENGRWPKDHLKAVEIFRRSCDLGQKVPKSQRYWSGSACNSLAIMIGEGQGELNPNATTEAKYFSFACELGYPSGCFNLAESYRIGSGVPQSDAKANRYHRKACKLGNKDACLQIR